MDREYHRRPGFRLFIAAITPTPGRFEAANQAGFSFRQYRYGAIASLPGFAAAPVTIRLALGTQEKWIPAYELFRTYCVAILRQSRSVLVLSQGMGFGMVVSIFAERSPEAVIAMLAIRKSVSTYLHFEADYPAEQLRLMVAEAALNLLVLTSSRRSEDWIWNSIRSVPIEDRIGS